MADVIYTGEEDEKIIKLILRKGLEIEGKIASKWLVARLALAYSLKIKTPPGEELDDIRDRTEGGKIHLKELTGQGKFRQEGEELQDYDDAICALLSVYHKKSLFNTSEYTRLLQRHVRRGLREFRNGWRDGHDFHEFLLQELFAGQEITSGNNQIDLKTTLEQGLLEIGIRGNIQKDSRGPRLTRFFCHLPDINDFDKLSRGVSKLNFFMGLQQQSIFLTPTSESKVVGIDIPRARSTWIYNDGTDLESWISVYRGSEILPVWPGVDVLGEPYCFDLALAPHLLVGGTTGSGKSVCLHALILSLLHKNSKNLKLCLIDPKRVEFELYNKINNLFGDKVITEFREVENILELLVNTMEQRSEKLAALGVRNIQEAHEKGEKDMPYIVVFVEELSNLFSQTKAAENSIVRLAEKARFSGIHLVLATQRPDAATFPGLLRSNVPARIALTVQKTTESKIIMDDTGAESLTGLGDMWVKTSQGELTRVHGVKIIQEDIISAINMANNLK